MKRIKLIKFTSVQVSMLTFGVSPVALKGQNIKLVKILSAGERKGSPFLRRYTFMHACSRQGIVHIPQG